MVLIKRGLDTKSKVRVLEEADVSVDEDKAKQALKDAKAETKQSDKFSKTSDKSETTTQSTDK